MAASIADMGAIRNLSDVCIRLIGAVETLTRARLTSTRTMSETVSSLSGSYALGSASFVEVLERQELKAEGTMAEEKRR
jgi:hypothetical protein